MPEQKDFFEVLGYAPLS